MEIKPTHSKYAECLECRSQKNCFDIRINSFVLCLCDKCCDKLSTELKDVGRWSRILKGK